jgi:hypothetical protein
MYRAPSGDIKELLMSLDVILKYLYSPKSEFIICDDKKINWYFFAAYVVC